MRARNAILAFLTALCLVLSSASASDTLTDYLYRYNRLAKDDVDSRLDLADWCKSHQLYHQQAELLLEALKLRPGQEAPYRDLLEADARRTRPVDPQWAQKMAGLLADPFRLYHSPHYTLLTDMNLDAAKGQLTSLEAAYTTFYQEVPLIGLRPLPPPGRLVCVLFAKYADYRDFQKRFEDNDVAWDAGQYSWRTNRIAFFDDQDSPLLRDAREKVSQFQTRIEFLKSELDHLAASATARRLQVQREIKRTGAQLEDLKARLAFAGKLGTLSKTRHEATHQLLFNSGLQHRERQYPFWLAEGLATLFEVADRDAHASPKLINAFRLRGYLRDREDSQLLPLKDFLTYRPADNDDTDRVAGRYSQAWALLHFFWNKRPDELKAYLEAIEKEGTPKDWAQPFDKYFTGDVDSIEQELRKHVDDLATDRP